MAHVANQHCGNGDVELEDAEDPCAYLTRAYPPDPPAMYRKLKDMCDQLEHLDPSWRLRRKEPVSVWPSLPNPSESIDFGRP